MPIIQINDTNHTGLIADITFTASTGPISSLGSHQIPYSFDSGSNDYFGTYELYYAQYNQTCQINYPPVLTFVVDTLVCSTFTFYIEGGSNFIMDIDWGDGSSIENFNSNNFYTPTHDYSPLNNSFTITITIDNPTTINAINSSAPYGYGCGNLLEIYNTNLLTNLTTVFLSNNKLSSNSINNLLIGLSGNGIGGGYAYLNNQTPPACPTGLGIDAQNHLENVQGWLVQTDYFCEPLLEITIDANIDQNVVLYIGNYVSSIPFNMIIDWGDGTPLDYSYTSNYNFYYPYYYYSTPGIYTAKFGFSNINAIEYIEGGYSNVTSLNNFNLLTNLYYVQFQSNRLSSSTINDILISLSGNGISSGQAYLNNQTPPACPTGLGLVAKQYLTNSLYWGVDVYNCTPSFQSVWTVDNNDTIYLPLLATGNYDFVVDWGDGTPYEFITSYTANTHTYAFTSTYYISIYGTIEGWNFWLVPTSATKIVGITYWGNLKFGDNVGNYFSNCTNLNFNTFIDVDIPDLSGNENLTSMFNNCTSLTTINNINNWDVSSVTGMTQMFYGTQFNQDIGNWDTRNVKEMYQMFSNSSFNNGGSSSINSWITSAVTNMYQMFFASQFNQDIGNWDVSNVNDMSYLFYSTPFDNGGSPSISGWTTSAVTSMIYVFGFTPFNQPIGNWDVSSVVDMTGMFQDTTQFNQDISSWKVSGVTSMVGMFENATQFNQDLSSWCVTQIPSLPYYFYNGATSWTGLPARAPQWGFCPPFIGSFVSVWETTSPNESIVLPYNGGGLSGFTGNIYWGDGSVSANSESNRVHTYNTPGKYQITIAGKIGLFSFNPNDVFNTFSSSNIKEIKQWGTGFTMGGFGGQFWSCENLVLTGVTDTPKITAQPSTLNNTFRGCFSITTINNLEQWNLNGITSLSFMFADSINFNQDIGSWNVSNVQAMDGMFAMVTQPSSSFNNGGSPSIGNWITSAVTNMNYMFSYATSFNQDLSNWCVSGLTVPTDFDTNAISWTGGTATRPQWGDPC